MIDPLPLSVQSRLSGWHVIPNRLVEQGVPVVMSREHAIVVHPLDYIELKHNDDTDCLAWLTESIQWAVEDAIAPLVLKALAKLQ